MKISFHACLPVSKSGARNPDRSLAVAATLLVLAGCAAPAPVADRPAVPIDVPARYETGSAVGDSALVPAVWINPDNPGRSLVAAVGDGQRFTVHSADGEVLASATPGRFGAVATLGQARRGPDRRVLFAATDALASRLVLLAVDPDTGEPDPAPFEIERLDFEPRGVCASELTGGNAEVFVISDAGELVRISVSVPRFGDVTLRQRARRGFGAAILDCAADHAHNAVWFSLRGSGIWTVPLRMEGDARPEPVARIGSAGLPSAPAGLTVVHSAGRALLIAAVPADDSLTAYALTGGQIRGGIIRVAEGEPLAGRFRIVVGNGVDDVAGPRHVAGGGAPGIPGLPGGLLAVSDQRNAPDGSQNVKLAAIGDLPGAMR